MWLDRVHAHLFHITSWFSLFSSLAAKHNTININPMRYLWLTQGETFSRVLPFCKTYHIWWTVNIQDKLHPWLTESEINILQRDASDVTAFIVCFFVYPKTFPNTTFLRGFWFCCLFFCCTCGNEFWFPAPN